MVPVDGLDEAVEVLEELPGEPALADAALAGHRDQPDAPVPGGRVVEVLEEPQLVVAPDERRLDRLGPARGRRARPTTRRARQAGTGASLPLRSWSPASAKAIAREAACIVASPTSTTSGGAAPCSRLAVLTMSPATMPSPIAADRHRCLAGHDTHPGVDHRAQSAHAADDLQGGPHGALGVVLVAGRGAPDCHHGVADELLDRAAVALDDPAGQVEVARQQVADLLRVPVLGDRREAHEVGEEDRDDAPLGHGWDGRGRGAGRDCRRSSGCRRPGQARPALTAEACRRRARRAAGGTGGRERRPAFEAELAARVVVRAAARTDHRNHPLERPAGEQ